MMLVDTFQACTYHSKCIYWADQGIYIAWLLYLQTPVTLDVTTILLPYCFLGFGEIMLFLFAT